MHKQIAFLGLGMMGGPMTANLASSGLQVMAWNRTSDRPGVEVAASAGAQVVSSIQEAVSSAEVIFTCVGDVPDVEAVILGPEGAAAFAQPGTLVVDMSTIGPVAARKIGAELQQRQLRFLDAPISGGDIGAQKGTLVIMVGGDEQDFTECKPLFEIMGKTIRLCGPVGSGQAVKLCNQVLCAVNIMSLCEALKLAEQQEIDPMLMVEVCSKGAAGSWALSNLGLKIADADLAPGFAIKHLLKDLRLVRESLQSSGQILPGMDIADRFLQIVKELDGGIGGELGTQAMIRAYREGGS
ncbi:MAG: NAD(P)-dependent oxidoreductase [Hormoscilla sp. GM102CHS1]|nr:NAD(P)-dependent oxidoreductase [Hormoscilla sp. GM102CHS1]